MSNYQQLAERLRQIAHKPDGEDSEWLPMSDLMSGLMILFMFIAISLILETQKVAETYQDNREKIYQELQQEFEKDLQKFGAEIDPKSLTVVFKSPDILFETGKSDLKSSYRATLTEFFPRYIRIVDKHKAYIGDVWIEGHTSSEWGDGSSGDTAYFENMRLSQERTRAVLDFVYHLNQVDQYRPWIKENIAAVGLSSSKTIKTDDGKEDKIRSKRVSFRIMTNSDEQMQQLLEDARENQ